MSSEPPVNNKSTNHISFEKSSDESPLNPIMLSRSKPEAMTGAQVPTLPVKAVYISMYMYMYIYIYIYIYTYIHIVNPKKIEQCDDSICFCFGLLCVYIYIYVIHKVYTQQ